MKYLNNSERFFIICSGVQRLLLFVGVVRFLVLLLLPLDTESVSFTCDDFFELLGELRFIFGGVYFFDCF